ncbi:hypothetical protein [Chelatococcus sp.]|uniref:hypothetical protein n=1 Tax=Chelatococcus sp. TaxID=1953771 RepID=UPI001ED01F09|nr:hypothetical protein [Chelatococcus sp.]MBX3543253.1 hypothetical protein [Chelatococcus sp.]
MTEFWTDFGIVQLPHDVPGRFALNGGPDRRYSTAATVAEYLADMNRLAKKIYEAGGSFSHAPSFAMWLERKNGKKRNHP